MDASERIDIRGDSTFALLLEAQRRGHDLFYYTPPNLALHGNRLLARGETLKVEDKIGAHYKLAAARVEDLAKQDVVLLRHDPPFDMAYITTTHLLERMHPKTLVVLTPLDGTGGAAISRIARGDTNVGSLVGLSQTVSREPFMVQQYRPE